MDAERAREIMRLRLDSFAKTKRVIRSMIDAAVKDAAKLGKSAVTINMPASVFGHEPYNLSKMGIEITKELFRDGFDVSGTYARMSISWQEGRPSSILKKHLPQQKQQEKKVVINVPKPATSAMGQTYGHLH